MFSLAPLAKWMDKTNSRDLEWISTSKRGLLEYHCNNSPAIKAGMEMLAAKMQTS